jgi:site-specific DNA recombinase
MSELVYVIGYARVSTPKQAQTGESLDAQEIKIRKYCADKGYILFPNNEVFREPFSGSNLQRPKYNEILELLKNNKGKVNIKYFVFWDFDRLTRGGVADYDQIWYDLKLYGVEPRDTTEIITAEKDILEEFGFDFSYEWAKARPSKEAETQKTEEAKRMKIKILQTLLIPEMRLTIAGYHIGRPDYGYENKKIFVEGKKKFIQARYELEAKYVEHWYKLRAEGIKTDKEIVEEINSMGYKSKLMIKWNKEKTKQIGTLGGLPLTEKHLQKVIKRTTYCGVICEKWTKYLPIRAKYEGLVSVEEWNKANKGKVFLQENSDGTLKLLKDVGVHGKKRYKYNPKFQYKGILKCDVCGKQMKGSASTGKSGGKFGAYHCERNHKRNAYSEKDVDLAFTNIFDSIKFTPTFLSILEKTLVWKFRQKEGEFAEITAKANINVSELEIQKSQLIKSFGNATLKEVQQSIEEEISKLQSEINSAKAYRDKLEIKEDDITEFIGWCKKIMEHPHKILENIGNPDEQRELFSLFFEEMPTYTELVSGTPKLSLVFKLSEEFKVNEDLLVIPRGIEPRFIP